MSTIALCNKRYLTKMAVCRALFPNEPIPMTERRLRRAAARYDLNSDMYKIEAVSRSVPSTNYNGVEFTTIKQSVIVFDLNKFTVLYDMSIPVDNLELFRPLFFL